MVDPALVHDGDVRRAAKGLLDFKSGDAAAEACSQNDYVGFGFASQFRLLVSFTLAGALPLHPRVSPIPLFG